MGSLNGVPGRIPPSATWSSESGRSAAGYPAVRELALLKSVGDRGVVASVCAAEVAAPEELPDYGYRPAMAAIAAALRPHLAK